MPCRASPRERDCRVRTPDPLERSRGRAFRRADDWTPISTSLLRFYQEERNNTRQLRRRDRDGPAPHPRRSRIRLPLRAAAGRRSRRGRRIESATPSSASRLSFFLWSSVPDDELLKLAIQGKLHEPAVLERQTRRMLADPRARALVTNFAGQWLYLRESEERESRFERVSRLRRQPASGVPARDGDAVRERSARGPVRCSTFSTRTTRS